MIKQDMIKRKCRTTYENFHIKTCIQRAVIKRNNFTYRIIFDVLTKYIKKDDTILDIGCGAGTVSLYFANQGHSVYGIDISKRAIDASIQSSKVLNIDKVMFKVMDFPEEIPAKSFDVVILCEVLEHLKDDEDALGKVFRLLKKGGIAVVSVPSKNAPLFKMGYTREFDRRVGHLRRYNLKELVKICEEKGFTILETRKTEGIIRNFLFVNPVAGNLIRFVKFFISDLVTILDNITIPLFGESNIFIVAKKPSYA